MEGPSLGSSVTDWEIFPLYAQRKSISPVGQSLTDVLYRSNFVLTLRPDGLPQVGLMYIKHFEFDVDFAPGSSILIERSTENELFSLLGTDVVKSAKKTLSSLLESHWKSALKDQYHRYIITSGLKATVQLRVDLACPVTVDKKFGGLGTTRRAMVVSGALEPFLKYGKEKIPLPSTGWTSLSILRDNIDDTFIPKTSIEAQMKLNIGAWKSKVQRNDTIVRTANYGLKTKTYEDAPDYEGQYLRFLANCKQSDVLGQQLTGGHCVTLPIELNRIFPEEQFMIHCSNVYPQGTKAYFFKAYKDPKTGSPVKAIVRSTCKDGWKHAVLDEKEGTKGWTECMEQQTAMLF